MMVENIKLATPFPASELVKIILENEVFNENASTTFLYLGNNIFLDSYSSNLKQFDFEVRSQNNNDGTIISLRILHGSIFTV